MTKEKNQKNLKQIIDNFLLINLFTVIFFAIFFIFAIIMQLNGIFVFINFIQIIWNPLIVPLITILIISALVNAINSWWRRKLLSQEEDIWNHNFLVYCLLLFVLLIQLLHHLLTIFLKPLQALEVN